MATILSARGLTVDYATRRGNVHAVRSVDLDIAAGEVVGLVGESGSGKSSVGLALLSLVRSPGVIRSGSVEFGGRDLLTLDDKQLRRVRGKEVSLIMQNPRSALNPMLRVGVQITDVLRAHGTGDKRAASARALEMLRLVGINDPERRLDAYPHELSGGMAQRVLIAIALSCSPKLLIADEPTSGLDVTIQAQILDDLARSVSTTGSAALIVTQDLGVVANYCDRIVVMNAGQVIEQAPVREFFARRAHPASRALVAAALKSAEGRLAPATGDSRFGTVSGCLLHPRCPWNDQHACRTQTQSLQEVSAGHLVRCHRWKQVTDTAPLEASVRPGDADD